MSLTPRWYLHAQTFERAGILEVPGAAAHPTILSFFTYTSLRSSMLAQSDETAWCSAFACAVMEQCRITSPKSAAARSWLQWGVRLEHPREGCIVVFDRSDPKNKNAAHVAFYAWKANGDDNIEVLGGNQKNRVCYATYETSKVLGYRWPIGEPLS